MKKTKRRHRPPPRKPSGDPRPRFVLHPASTLDPEKLTAALISRAARLKGEFPDLWEGLRNLLRATNPLQLLSVLANYGLVAGVTSRGVEPGLFTRKIQQHHIELLQAVILTLPPAEWGTQSASLDKVEPVIDALTELADAFHQRRYSAMEGEHDQQARTVLATQEHLRLHTQFVRNWGYYGEVVAFSQSLYGVFDDRLRTRFGFGATDLIQVANAMVRLLEARITVRFNRHRRIFHEHNVRRVVKAFCREYPDMSDPEAVIAEFGPTAPLDRVKMFLLSFADLQLVGEHSFMPAEIAGPTGIAEDVVAKVFGRIVLLPGALVEFDPEHVFMGNPVWPAPAIVIPGGVYCCLPQAVFSHIHDVMRALLEEAGLKEALSARRAQFLEETVADRLAKVMPGAVVRNNVKWTLGAQEFETDHIAKLDRTLIIVEDKSAALSQSGLRGGAERVKKHVQDLILAPSVQSARLEETVRRAQQGDAAAAAALAPFGIAFSDIDQIARVSVTLDDFSVLSSAELELKAAGWIPADMVLAPCMNMADFAAVTDITHSPAFFVHYLLERARFQHANNVVGDELDYMGFYLDTGFNTLGGEGDGVNLTITGASDPIDRYYINREADVHTPRPAPRLTPFFKKLIAAIEDRRPQGWLNITTALLRCADYMEQRKVDSLMQKLRAMVRKNWRDPDHQSSVMCLPPAGRDTVIVFFAFPPQLEDQRQETTSILAQKAMEESGRDRCLVVGRNTERWGDPYAFLWSGFRGPEKTPA